MKLLAEKSFMWRDRQREVMIAITKGQHLECDESDLEEAKDIYALLQSGAVSVSDDRFIKQEADYIGVFPISEQREDLTWLRVRPGHTIRLKQREASRLLTSGHIKPEKESAWIPKKLLAGGVSVREPRKMFDDLVSTGENWIRKGMR